MKKLRMVLKGVLTATCILFIAANMFMCFICGPDSTAALKYLISAAILSILMPSAICGEIWYILRQEKRIEELERKLENKLG